jgi:SAM-dependent methyltransferase
VRSSATMSGTQDRFAAWIDALEARHLADLGFPEVRRALQALSSLYVERRGRMRSGAALDGAGKRAAFALYYGPTHHLLVREVVRALGSGAPPPGEIVDLGCGTGTAGAAWARECTPTARLTGVDLSGWAVREARWTYRQLGLRGRAVRDDAATVALPRRGGGVIAAFVVNELADEARSGLLSRLLDARAAGAMVLVVEPLSRRINPWWAAWADAIGAAGGRENEWRFAATLPELARRLGRAAGLDTRELTGRTLALGFP